ncbi:MAG: hypothetical protein KAR32_05495 [Candidatus Omnitrophica bacterium]|nr:hypothetical protein [Candidatus Omnitrophota bacterium]
MVDRILKELKVHAPFTIWGSMTGVVMMLFSQKIPDHVSSNIFYLLHPVHVVLSALVTSSMYKLHKCGHINGKCLQGKCNFWILLIIGYVGSIGIATLSDSVIPYFGESMLNMPKRELHLGFIEKWWLINPLALLGVAIAYFRPATKFPHAGHVLLSAWASLFHMIMASGESVTLVMYPVVFIFLFLAVWLPCCLSDIVFPLLFVNGNTKAGNSINIDPRDILQK